jgi:UDP-N-acetylmuramate--alanine ligase
MEQAQVFQKRRTGVLLHITSLPSAKLGEDAYRFVDLLEQAGVSVWQMLPLGPTHSDGSPYQCLSAHAGNTKLICMKMLKQQPWANAVEIDGLKRSAKIAQAYHQFMQRASDEEKNAFSDFVEKVPKHGQLFYCNDNRDVVDVAEKAKCRKYSYGFSNESDYVVKIKENKLLQRFEVFYQEESLGDFEIKFPGRHNALNATAVIAFCHEFGLETDLVRDALASFKGTARRFERVGERKGAVLIDDYAHHPEEIKVTLEAVKEIFPSKNIITVFHPHSFSRTEALIEDFSHSFGDTSKLIVLDIYGSARESSGRVTSKDLVDLVNKYSPRKAEHIPSIKEAIEFLESSIGENDVIVSMGAGDVWQVTHKLAK